MIWSLEMIDLFVLNILNFICQAFYYKYNKLCPAFKLIYYNTDFEFPRQVYFIFDYKSSILANKKARLEIFNLFIETRLTIWIPKFYVPEKAKNHRYFASYFPDDGHDPSN